MPKIVVTDVDEGPQEDVVAIDGAAKKRKRPLASEPDVAVGKKKSREKEKKEMRAETAATELRQKAPKKAKKEAAPPPEAARATQKETKEPKQSKKKKGAAEDDEEAADVASLDAQTQARFLWEAYTGLFGGSFLEQEAFEEKNILPLPAGPTLEARIQAAVPGWRGKFATDGVRGEKCGAPRLLVVSSSALRTLELLRQMGTFQKGCKAIKLFSKHIKQEEQAEELQSRVVCVGAGTPNRITRLAETEALSLDRLELVVIDLHRDVKKRSLLDIPETRADWWELFKGHLSKRVAEGKTQLCLFS